MIKSGIPKHFNHRLCSDNFEVAKPVCDAPKHLSLEFCHWFVVGPESNQERRDSALFDPCRQAWNRPHMGSNLLFLCTITSPLVPHANKSGGHNDYKWPNVMCIGYLFGR